ncbi:AAA family ATPase [Magnetococcales bacterium HHB-1]
MSIKPISYQAGDHLSYPAENGLPELYHLFDKEEIEAINTALAAERPLLVRGEPGIGKSQFSYAAAIALNRAFLPFVVNNRTEATDLQWHFDAVSRLAEAQIQGAFRAKSDESYEREYKKQRQKLDVINFVYPRTLWWAFDWSGAENLARQTPPQRSICNPEQGCVVLIDEIDKAESDLPNGLLEALGAGHFYPPGRSQPVIMKGVKPLIIITTNEERVLPDAFLRRCLVLHKYLPNDPQELKDYLIKRAEVHFPSTEERITSPQLFGEAAERLIEDRQFAQTHSLRPLPGQAEYLDMIRAAINLAPKDPGGQKKLLDKVSHFTLKKHPEMKSEMI